MDPLFSVWHYNYEILHSYMPCVLPCGELVARRGKERDTVGEKAESRDRKGRTEYTVQMKAEEGQRCVLYK